MGQKEEDVGWVLCFTLLPFGFAHSTLKWGRCAGIHGVRFGAAVVENGKRCSAVLVRLWCCGVGCAELKEMNAVYGSF